MKKRLILLVAASLLGCRNAADIGEPSAAAIVPIYFATNRAPTGSAVPDEFYAGEMGPLSFGVVEVSVPPSHQLGAVEQPSLLDLELDAAPGRHVVLQRVTPQDERSFLAMLQDRLRRSNDKSLFVFVHGYNLDFAESARRAAQMANDLLWDGVALLYSWPSRGNADDYWTDERAALDSAADLAAFLDLIAAYSGAAKLHLVAHSMGNIPTLAALARHAEGTGATGVPLIDELIVAAPDVDAAEFSGLIQRVAPSARRSTLYVSENDDALKLSGVLHGRPRAGDSSAGRLILPGVDTIDASAVDSDIVGHSYYGENRQVLADIFNLLRSGQPPGERFGLQPAVDQGQGYWIIQP
ncbi:MAG: alpha/beta hydrolase [Dongiaceae bacterium]